MQRLLFVSLILIFCFISAYSQFCLPEGITFTTQAQIDSFQINYPGCTEIEGRVEICGADISNLDGLMPITSIYGSLVIGDSTWTMACNDSLVSLSGLNNLHSVFSDLTIVNNESLTDLTALNNLSNISGSLNMISNHKIIDFSGLENITQINEDLYVEGNSSLLNFTGLNNLDSIGNDLCVNFNASLANFAGLDSLHTINGIFQVGYMWTTSNGSLENFSGLGNLALVGDEFYILQNPSLSDLSGMDNLSSVGSLWIFHNGSLASLSGLENLSQILGGLNIENNDSLLDLSGLNGLDSLGGYLSIKYNDKLKICNNQFVCNFLDDPTGGVNIYLNDIGCNNPWEIADACGIQLECLPFGSYNFNIQSDIDSFQVNFPGCNALKGYVIISGDSITNLHELETITSIGQSLILRGNDLLTDMIGLHNLHTINGRLELGGGGFWYQGNELLHDMTGLEGLNVIRDGMTITSNHSLIDFSGFENLDSISGNIYIGHNDSLLSLNGLDEVDLSEVWLMELKFNPSLSYCHIISVCDYLNDPTVYANFGENFIGCDSEEEVLDSCESNTVKIEEQHIKDNYILYPNPANQELNISVEGYNIDEVIIYTLTGQQVMHKRPVNGTIDISALQPGMYIVEVTVGGLKVRQKLLVQR